MTVADIIEKFGGTSAFADALSAPISTVHSWKRSNYIPPWRHRYVLELALERSIPLSTADFPERVAA
jgi:hypothetical protein